LPAGIGVALQAHQLRAHFFGALVTQLEIFFERAVDDVIELLNGLPKDAPLVISAYLPTRMDRLFYRSMQEPQFLTCFDPRDAG
jgi:hypothetical protein